MSDPLDWDVDGRDWPHRDTSMFIDSPGIRWHVQRMGEGPVALLLHGTGAAAHSWRSVLPLLAQTYTCIAPDLPGHGFTTGRPRGGLSLNGMATAIGDLCAALEIRPQLIVGHSAGMAIALQNVCNRDADVRLVGLSAAITPFSGIAALMFPAMAKLLFLNPLAPRLFAARARIPGETRRFLDRATSSRIDAVGLRCYEVLFGNSRHCAGALEMMASWDLGALDRNLAKVSNRILLIHGAEDPAVGLAAAVSARDRLANAEFIELAGMGHLAHEEAPERISALIAEFAAR